ncbi:MAG TPA: YtxH domain-containing protein [Chitinophagaceae bacterium]|jgi:gas vesicle protein|nr:YtxH domain-containing protein [Chitinophagaceae bacterium]
MSSKFLTGVILGAAAGAAIALFITSEKGQEMIDDITGAAGDVAGKAKKQWDNLSDELAALLKKGKAIVDDLEQKAKEANA